MSSLNKAIIVGNLGKDPEVRYTPSGAAVTNITLATTERYKDKATGETKEITEWHRIVFFNKLAEIAGQYLKKGSKCLVEGSLRTRKYQDSNGIDKYTTEIVATNMRMLSGHSEGSESSGRQNTGSAAATSQNNDSGFDDFDDDIPF